MIRVASLLRRGRREEGGVLLMFGLMLPGLLLLAALALEIGNWYEHRRHLQLQTDAGALAAGQLFRDCASDPGAQLTPMTQLAAQYGGDTVTYSVLGGGPLVNQQVGQNGPAAGNLPAFSYQGTAYPPDYTPVADTNPCTSGVFDVHATEDAIPHIFSISPLATVHAHSRVEMKAINQMRGLLPLGVPDVRPKYVFASFVNSSGNPITTEFPLSQSSADASVWMPASPVSVPIPVGDVRVRLRLVSGPDSSLACGQLYTVCLDTVYIRGWDSTKAAPTVHDVWLLPGTSPSNCSPDSYYTSDDCTAGLTADVDLGSANPVTVNTTLWATVDGKKTQYQLSPSKLGSGVIKWTLNSGMPLAGIGAHTISLGFNAGLSGSKDQSLGDVHHAVVAEPGGPLNLVQVLQGGVAGANTFAAGTSPALEVRIKTIGNLLLSKPTDAPIYLRVFKNVSASQDQTIDCDPDLKNLQDEIAQGCSPFYIKNPSLTCPDPNALWNLLPAPLPCAKTEQGAKVGPIGQALSQRIFGKKSPTASDCSIGPVNWIRNQGFLNPDDNADDKRALPLIVTPLGAFADTGQGVVPVIDFAYFYVTGYNGDPCEGVDLNQDPVPGNRGAYVIGHFIKFFPLDDVVASDDKCDLTSITPCVAVLTR